MASAWSDAPATVNSSETTTAPFLRLRTPAKASMNFVLWLQDRSKQGFSLRLEKVTRSFFFFFANCIHLWHGHAHALIGHLEHGHHSRRGRHAGHPVSDCDKPSARSRSRSTCGALPGRASPAGYETNELFEVLASKKFALTQGDSGLLEFILSSINERSCRVDGPRCRII